MSGVRLERGYECREGHGGRLSNLIVREHQLNALDAAERPE